MTTNIENIVNHAEVSEKSIEKYLVYAVRRLGGVCLKYSNCNMVGYPDRLALMPAGKTIWFELKSKGKHPSKMQNLRFEGMRLIGHPVYVVDSREGINNILTQLGYDIQAL